MLGAIHRTAQRPIPENSSVYSHNHKSTKSHINFNIFYLLTERLGGVVAVSVSYLGILWLKYCLGDWMYLLRSFMFFFQFV
jgi:hypothetical protein